jgi:hypothetical protein
MADPNDIEHEKAEREKKEKVLHTRIPESLDEEIRERSAKLGISVSNLVRNVLQNAFGLVEDIVADAASIGRSARGESGEGRRNAEGPQVTPPAEPAEAGRPGRVLGWQEAVLELNAVCERCNAILARGARAAIAVIEGTGPRPIRCLPCLKEVVDGNS